MDLRHPVSGDPFGITMQIIGADAPSYRAALRRVRDDIAKNLAAEPSDPDCSAPARLTKIASPGFVAFKMMAGNAHRRLRFAACHPRCPESFSLGTYIQSA